MTRRTSKRHGRVRRQLLRLLGVSLVVLGILAAGLQLFAPQTSERIVGEIRVKAHQAKQRVTGQEYPVVRLSGRGGMAELDGCDGSFVRIRSYEAIEVQPVHAAHNNCHGEVILPLEVGDQLEVAGRGLWEVTEIRDLSKTWSAADELLGMKGKLILQTCYWGEPTMKFIAIRPVRASDRTEAT